MLEFFNQAMEYLSANTATITMGLGILWMIIGKVFSNEKAGPVVQKIQAGLDFVAKACEGLGKLCAALSAILANMIKSDGFLGKK